MKLKKLKLKNIRSYESQEIEFPEGSLLLSGDIGSGKTSVLMAIEYALFGLQPGQKGSALLRNNVQSGEVTLEFEIDGQDIIIERKLKRDAKSVANEYSAISIDHEKIECSVTELKTKILTLLHYPPEFLKKNNVLYKYTIYTPQEQMKQIILEEPEARLNVLGYIFGIDKYKRIRENLIILLNKLKEESKFLQGDIKTLDEDKTKLLSIERFTTLLEDKIRKRQKELEEAVLKRKSVETEFADIEKKIKEKELFEKESEKTRILISSKKENLNTLVKELNEAIKNLSESGEAFDDSKFKVLLNEISLKKDELEKLNSKYIDIAGKINSLEQNKLIQTEKKNRVFKIDICPTCLQNVPYTHKHNILNETERELAELSNKTSALEKDRKDILSSISKIKSELSDLEEEKTKMQILKSKSGYIQKSKERVTDVKKSMENLEKDIALLSSHLSSLKENILKFSKFSNLLKLKHGELEHFRDEEKRAEVNLAGMQKELEMTFKEIAEIKRTIANKEISKKKLSEILDISDWLSNQFSNLVNFIERNVMIKLRIEFARLFNKWFHMLAGDSFEVQLDENFTPLMIQGETEMDYAFLSGGERTAIALAYRLALNQTINSLFSNIKTKDIIILDEPTDGFSEVQLDKMRDVFEEINAGQLIIVSHDQKIEGFVDSIIRIKKEGEVSHIENAQH
jgi:exonuclease SbcC